MTLVDRWLSELCRNRREHLHVLGLVELAKTLIIRADYPHDRPERPARATYSMN